MARLRYNDMEFAIDRSDRGWDIARQRPDGSAAVVAAGLYPELPEAAAIGRAQALVRTMYPCGVRLVAPDVAHAMNVGGLRIVGPDVGRPGFVHWTKDSASFAK